MKFKKTVVSLLSVTALAFSASSMVSAKEISLPQKSENITQDFKTAAVTTVATWGWPSSVSLESKTITTLDTFSFGKGTGFSIDGYQESGSFGTPDIVYSLHEKKSGGNTSSAVWTGRNNSSNGYMSFTIPSSVIDSSKTYILKAENKSSFTVKLRGNAYKNS
ncbi:hypothetical protein [Bacillus haynesii]|uniref:hypothetical protein n=1 Tax=Bacillus haynesii TaxID=1925021 RepID=UPI0035E0AF4A